MNWNYDKPPIDKYVLVRVDPGWNYADAFCGAWTGDGWAIDGLAYTEEEVPFIKWCEIPE